VDLRLRVAGPGSRALAFLLDWLIRSLAALAWYTAAATIYHRRLQLAAPANVDEQWFLAVLAPAIAIFLLYHCVLEVAMHGRTPGKRLAGIRIVTREGGTPSPGVLLARNVFRIIDSFPLLYSVGLATAMLNRRHARVGDLAAGTLLVQDRMPPPPLPSPVGELEDGMARELAAELNERWAELLPQARQPLARALLGRGAAGFSSDPASQDDSSLRRALARVGQGAAS